MSHNLKKIVPKLLIFVVLTILVVIIICSLNDIQEIGKVLKNIDVPWLLLGFLFLFFYMIFYPLPLYILGKSKTEKNISYLDSAMIGTMEYFFNGITPFASGGQPFQIYAYRKIGVELKRSSGIILMNFVITQISIVLLCLSSLFFYDKLTNGTIYLQVMIGVGLGINCLILVIFCSVGLSKTLRNWLIRLVGWIIRRKIFKGKLLSFESSFAEYCKGAQETFHNLLSQKLKFVCCILFKLIGLLCYYMIPFFILHALDIPVKINQLPLITAMTTFSIAMTCFIPTPGATGGIEFAFRTLFVSVLPIISGPIATSGLLVWRFITYYFLMIISFIVYLAFERVVAHRIKKQEEAPQKSIEK